MTSLAPEIATWLVGFLPIFEIYIAVPTGVALGLTPVAAAFWGTFGNAAVVPVVMLFYDRLLRIGWFRQRLTGRSERWKASVEKWGVLFVFVMTPILGVWIMSALGLAAGINRSKLVVASLISISVYAGLIAASIAFGLDLFTA